MEVKDTLADTRSTIDNILLILLCVKTSSSVDMKLPKIKLSKIKLSIYSPTFLTEGNKWVVIWEATRYGRVIAGLKWKDVRVDITKWKGCRSGGCILMYNAI